MAHIEDQDRISDVDSPHYVDSSAREKLDRPSACILWIYFNSDTLLLGPFLWFGGAPGEKIPTLGEKVATHTKHNAQGKKGARPGHRVHQPDPLHLGLHHPGRRPLPRRHPADRR